MCNYSKTEPLCDCRICLVLTGFVVYRFKLHRHLVDGTVKSACFRQVSVYSGFALDKLHCITNSVQMNSKVIQLIFNNLITLRNCLWLTHYKYNKYVFHNTGKSCTSSICMESFSGDTHLKFVFSYCRVDKGNYCSYRLHK